MLYYETSPVIETTCFFITLIFVIFVGCVFDEICNRYLNTNRFI